MAPYPTHEPVEPASTQYQDLKGTLSADFAYDSSIYDLAGIDPEIWQVVGFDISVYGPSLEIFVMAANKDDLGVTAFEDWARVASETGEIPVTQFALPDGVDLTEFLSTVFKRFSMIALGAHLAELRFVVKCKDDAPYGHLPKNR